MRTRAEQEVTYRWDQEERVLWAGTTVPWIAAKWARSGFAVRILSYDPGGNACSWEVKSPWTGSRRPWSRLFQDALPPSRSSRKTTTISSSRGKDDSKYPDAA
jgi:hypothetical protein